jgi:SAM-dependent methyltransferase
MSLLKLDFGKTPVRLSLESFLQQHATSEFTLEIGAGRLPYKEWFPNRVAMDINYYSHNHVQADAHCLPFSDGAFNTVLCTEVLEHLHTPSLALKEMRRVLAPGGKLILTTPFAYPIHDAPGDYYRYTRFGLTYLLRDWNLEYLSESTRDWATILTFFHYWLGKHKGFMWKLPKLVWLGVWSLSKRSYQKGAGRLEARSLMPTGYLVVARRSCEASCE